MSCETLDKGSMTEGNNHGKLCSAPDFEGRCTLSMRATLVSRASPGQYLQPENPRHLFYLICCHEVERAWLPYRSLTDSPVCISTQIPSTFILTCALSLMCSYSLCGYLDLLYLLSNCRSLLDQLGLLWMKKE